MSESTLVAETGRPTGSRASGRLRAAGKIPGVLYGHGLAPVSLAVDRRELRHALSARPGSMPSCSLEGRRRDPSHRREGPASATR